MIKPLPTVPAQENAAVRLQTTDTTPATEVEAVLEYHRHDAVSAIETLLADCRHLRIQLALAEAAMGSGFTRGWRPQPDRDETDR